MFDPGVAGRNTVGRADAAIKTKFWAIIGRTSEIDGGVGLAGESAAVDGERNLSGLCADGAGRDADDKMNPLPGGVTESRGNIFGLAAGAVAVGEGIDPA